MDVTGELPECAHTNISACVAIVYEYHMASVILLPCSCGDYIYSTYTENRHNLMENGPPTRAPLLI